MAGMARLKVMSAGLDGGRLFKGIQERDISHRR